MVSLSVACVVVFAALWTLAEVGLRRKWWKVEESAAFNTVLAVADLFMIVGVVAAFAAV